MATNPRSGDGTRNGTPAGEALVEEFSVPPSPILGPDAFSDDALPLREGGLGNVGGVDVGPAGRGDTRVASAGKVEAPVGAVATGMSGGSAEDGRAIFAVVQEAQPGIRRCYEQVLSRDRRLSGKVTLSWTVAADGAAEDVAVIGTTLKDADVENCVQTRVRNLEFPAPKSGPVKVEFPFVFQPSTERS